MPTLEFIASPDALAEPPDSGRIALVDLAFAAGDGFARVTRPFLDRVGERLAVWIDHHDHPEWTSVDGDSRFVLVPKRSARACPQLVSEELVRRVGAVEHVWAHADFDGCVAATKFMRGGHPPYPEADEDARFADAPGQGFQCSNVGRRYLAALDELRASGDISAYMHLLHGLAKVLITGLEPEGFSGKIDALGRALEQRRAELTPLYKQVTRPHSDVALLAQERLSSPDKKFLLREMQEMAAIAVIFEGGWSMVATFQDERFNLSELPGMKGQRGYAFGEVEPSHFLPALIAMLG